MFTSSDCIILIIGLLFGCLFGIAYGERKLSKIADTPECFHYKGKIYKVKEVKK